MCKKGLKYVIDRKGRDLLCKCLMDYYYKEWMIEKNKKQKNIINNDLTKDENDEVAINQAFASDELKS